MTTSSMAMSLATTALSEARQEIERLRAELVGMTASYQQASDESSGHYQEANQLSEQLATQTARADDAERERNVLLDALKCMTRELVLSDVDLSYIESHFRPWLNKAYSAVAEVEGTLFSPAEQKPQPVAADVVQVDREKVRDAVAAALGDAMDCTRVWSAWSYGTMSRDDFCIIAEDEDRLNEIVDAALLATRQEGSKV